MPGHLHLTFSAINHVRVVRWCVVVMPVSGPAVACPKSVSATVPVSGSKPLNGVGHGRRGPVPQWRCPVPSPSVPPLLPWTGRELVGSTALGPAGGGGPHPSGRAGRGRVRPTIGCPGAAIDQSCRSGGRRGPAAGDAATTPRAARQSELVPSDTRHVSRAPRGGTRRRRRLQRPGPVTHRSVPRTGPDLTVPPRHAAAGDLRRLAEWR